MRIKKIFSTIAFKLIVPIVILFIIVMSIAFSKRVGDYNEFVKTKSEIEIDALINAVNNKSEAALNSAVFTSSMYSDFSSVKWALSLYNKTNDIDTAFSIIERNIQPGINTIIKNTGVKPKIQFHLPNSKSLYKTWSKKYGNDISYRKPIKEISKNHKAIKSIDVDENGLILTGIAPIFDAKNNYLGSVETIFPYDIIFDRIIKNNEKKKESYAVFIFDNKSNLKNTSNKKIGNFILHKKSTNFIDNYINANDFNFRKDDVKRKITKDCICSTMPLRNYFGDIVGAVSMQIDISRNNAIIKKQIIRNVISGFIIIIIVIITIYLGISWVVTKPINKLARDINELANGKILSTINVKQTGVISVIYTAFNTMLNRIKETTNFANQIGKGNLDVEFKNLNNEDALGQALVKMKDNLLQAKKLEEKNKIEEEKRAWTTKGFADFAEILRNNNTNIEELATNILIKLVNYTNSNQGGLFLLNDNDENNITLELISAYAYNRKKYVDKVIKYGEGLVGTCAIEKETIFLTEVPDNYLDITSGLGHANPRCILIVPLKFEDKVFGVIEIASFSIYEDYQIKFIEKLAESIASTLSIAKTNILTNELLEQSQQQAEELSATEEEMRQNLEEMQSTQEQLEETNITIKQKNNEMQAQMQAIDKVALVSKTDTKGIITYVNDLFCEVAGYSREELLGEPHNIVRHPDMPKAAFKNLWDTIQAGVVWSGKVKNRKKDGDYYWVDANVSPIYDEYGEIKEYIGIRYLVTHYIDDESTITEIKKAFPDVLINMASSIKKETKKNEKVENNIKINHNLINELKEEHEKISNILIELQENGVRSKKGMDLLIRSKELLLAHLKKEDDELYPVLNKLSLKDESLKNTLDIFGSEMERITEFVMSFYSEYTNIEKIEKKSFIKDITKFIVAFKDRISKEEMIIYKVYNKTIK